MRSILVSEQVRVKIAELELYLKDTLMLSEQAALKRSGRMREFVHSLGNPADYPLCRFRRWCDLSYRCAVFENDWVFAYEVLPQGIIIRDMSHTSLLAE